MEILLFWYGFVYSSLEALIFISQPCCSLSAIMTLTNGRTGFSAFTSYSHWKGQTAVDEWLFLSQIRYLRQHWAFPLKSSLWMISWFEAFFLNEGKNKSEEDRYMKTNSPALTYSVSPIDTVLSTDYWISHFQPWWKNQSCIAQKNVIHTTVYTISVCTVLDWGQCWCELRFLRGVTYPKKTPVCFCTQLCFSLNLLQFSVLIKKKSIPPEINIDLSRAKTVTELFERWWHLWSCTQWLCVRCSCCQGVNGYGVKHFVEFSFSGNNLQQGPHNFEYLFRIQ